MTVTLRKSQLSDAVEKIRTPPMLQPGGSDSASGGTQASEIRPGFGPPPDDDSDDDDGTENLALPSGWSKGALLNVRNRGSDYCITLYPEEYDPRYPERALLFANSWECQDFVSKWYSRETADPRAR